MSEEKKKIEKLREALERIERTAPKGTLVQEIAFEALRDTCDENTDS
jgi:hypothetical protein